MEMGAKEGGGTGGWGGGDMFGRALCDNLAAGLAAFRPQVDEVVGLGQNIEMMLDDHDGVAGIDETMEEFDQPSDIGKV